MVARLIALLICDRVEDDDGATKNIFGVHNMRLTDDTQLSLTIYASYDGVAGPHDVGVGVENEIGAILWNQPTRVDPQNPAPIQTSIMELGPVPCSPGDFKIHLSVDGEDIGWTPFGLRPMTPPS